ncbi:MAG: Helix-turn-helix domain [Acidimicrobiales bacterium]|nr:Helix-turn-helix domain [Acidimicrobiales bacterium]
MSELETRWHDLGEFIREQRRVGHLSLRKLSEMAGISNPYLSQIERGLRKPSAEILQQIARALEISSETLYVRAGILEAREGDTDLVTEIRRDPWINEEQKKTLVQIYESFRAERRAAGFDADVIPNAAHAAALAALRETDEAAERRTSGDPESEALAGR